MKTAFLYVIDMIHNWLCDMIEKIEDGEDWSDDEAN